MSCRDLGSENIIDWGCKFFIQKEYWIGWIVCYLKTKHLHILTDKCNIILQHYNYIFILLKFVLNYEKQRPLSTPHFKSIDFQFQRLNSASVDSHFLIHPTDIHKLIDLRLFFDIPKWTENRRKYGGNEPGGCDSRQNQTFCNQEILSRRFLLRVRWTKFSHSELLKLFLYHLLKRNSSVMPFWQQNMYTGRLNLNLACLGDGEKWRK